MAVEGEGRGGKDSEQTAPLSRRGTIGCESEGKQERGNRERGTPTKGQRVEGFFKMPEDSESSGMLQSAARHPYYDFNVRARQR